MFQLPESLEQSLYHIQYKKDTKGIGGYKRKLLETPQFPEGFGLPGAFLKYYPIPFSPLTN